MPEVILSDYFYSLGWGISIYNLPGRNDRRTFCPVFEGDFTSALRPGDIVVMDNMRSHHVKAVREILEAKGMKVPYLPPYSPDPNPIEKMWSKMKAILHCWKIRNLNLLPEAIQKALSWVSPLDCSHWFAASVYC